MSVETLDLIRTVVQVIAFAVGGALALVWGIRGGFIRLQHETVDTYKEAIAAMELKMAELEARVAHLEQKNEELMGELEGKELVIAELVREITESGLCKKAMRCVDREVPMARRRRHTEPADKTQDE